MIIDTYRQRAFILLVLPSSLYIWACGTDPNSREALSVGGAIFCLKKKLNYMTAWHDLVRPLQFNYLSYKLFFGKKILSDSKKKEKKVTFGVLRMKVVLKFSVRLQKKKKKKCKF